MPTTRAVWMQPPGIHIAQEGGTVHMPEAAVTVITPLDHIEQLRLAVRVGMQFVNFGKLERLADDRARYGVQKVGLGRRFGVSSVHQVNPL